MSVVANVAINLDARGVTERLKAIRQTSIGAADGFAKLGERAQAVKSIVEAQQGSFAKASTVQGVFAAKVKNTEFAIKEQINALRDVQSKVQIGGALYQKAARQIAQYEEILRKTNTTAEQSGRSFDALQNSLAALGVGAALFNAQNIARSFINAANAADASQRQIKLVSQGFDDYRSVLQVAQGAASRFGLSQTQAANAIADIYTRLRPVGFQLNEINAIYEGFNTAVKLSGVSAEAASIAFLQLSQGLGSGTLQGDELRSVLEQMPAIAQAIAKEMDINVGNIKKFGSEGKITSDIIVRALDRVRTEGANKLAQALDTPQQRIIDLQNAFEDLKIEVGGTVAPLIIDSIKQITAAVKETTKFVGDLKSGFDVLAGAASGITLGIGGIDSALGGVIGRFNELGRNAGLKMLLDLMTLGGASILGGIAGIGKRRKGRQGYSAPAGPEMPVRLSMQGRTFGAGGSGGGGATNSRKATDKNDADRLAEELKRSFEEGRQLSVEFSRQIMLLNTTSEIEKKRLQIVFDYQDNLKKVLGLKNKEQRNAGQLLVEDLKRRQNRELDLQTIKDGLNAFERIAGLNFSNTEGLGIRAFGQGGAGAFRTDINLDPNAKQTRMDEMRQKLDDLVKTENQVYLGAQAIGEAFGTAFKGIASGAMTAQEALAGMMSSIADHFLDMAAQIITQQMTMIIYGTIMKALGLTGRLGGGFGVDFSGAFGAGAGPIPGVGGAFGGGMKLFADGGFVTGPTSAVIGEGGEPEYIIPASKMRSAMSRYATGARGSAVIPAGDDTNAGGGTATMAPTAIDVRYTVERINSVDYVTADQFRAGMAQAAQQGATQGEQRTLRRLQQSRATRSRLGMN